MSHEHRLNRIVNTSLEKDDRITEEKEESHRQVEETALQAQVEGATTRIKVKAQARLNHMEKSMINPKSNVIIVKIMGIMPMNVERNKMT